MKPSFIIVFGPVAAVYALLRWRLIDLRLLWLGVLACLPSLLLLGYQYYKNFHVAHDPIQFTWFGVWKTFSRNIPYSILLGTAFPLALSVVRFRALLKNDYLQLSWGLWFVGFLQFAFLAETKYFSAGNFSWGYNISLSLLFVFCTAEWVRWIKETSSVQGFQKFALAAISALFALHLVSGVVYLFWQLQGRPYF
jgi:hypothetical protein